MKWLMFTKSNGDISSLRFKDTLENSKKLCPPNSKRFYVLDDEVEPYPNFPIWDSSSRKYIVNDSLIIEDERVKLKRELHKSMSQTTVEINGKVFWADPESEKNFAGRIREMELNGRAETKWAQGIDVFIATLDELKHVYKEGTKKNASLWDKYIDDIEALKGGE